MSEFKGTPGPWNEKNYGYEGWKVVENYNPTHVICKIPSSTDETTPAPYHDKQAAANARLIAAAPKLLDACQEMLDTLTKPSRIMSDITRSELAPWLPMLKEVIALALGETE